MHPSFEKPDNLRLEIFFAETWFFSLIEKHGFFHHGEKVE
jgi:hypothetical protein